MNEMFRKFAQTTSAVVGSSWAFITAVLIVVLWPLPVRFLVSQTPGSWSLIPARPIITFLMVFLIQNTQNRDAKAIHIKLDELIKAVSGARTGLVDLEELSDKELDRLKKEFRRLHFDVNGNAKKTASSKKSSKAR